MGEPEKRHLWIYESGNEIVDVDPRVTFDAETAVIVREADYTVTEYVPVFFLDELRKAARELLDKRVGTTREGRGWLPDQESVRKLLDRLEAVLDSSSEQTTETKSYLVGVSGRIQVRAENAAVAESLVVNAPTGQWVETPMIESVVRDPLQRLAEGSDD